MKADRNFKMPSQYKTLFSLARGGKEMKNLWKKSFIDAALAVEEFKKAKHKGD